MNRLISKYLFYYPVTSLKGEFVGPLLKKYRQNQFYTKERLRMEQQRNAIRLIEHARENTEFYSERLKGLVINDDNFWEVFSHIPFTKKSDLISSSEKMCAKKGLFTSSKTTGGSTGEPVKLLKNPGALARERAATWRSYEWAGVGIGDPQGRFWGVPHSEVDSNKAKIIDLVANRKRVSAFNLTKQSMAEYYITLKKFKPAYLYGYVSVLEVFANYIIDNDLPSFDFLKSVITTSEVLSEASRIQIQSAFKVKVYNEYGCGEVGSIAHECEKGSLHLMADNLIVETLSGESTGELVITDLFNYAQPLIRYRVGDYATLSDEICDCGVCLPLISEVHGRAYDLISTSSERKIHPEAIMYLFEGLQAESKIFEQFQVVQKSMLDFEVRVIPTEKWQNMHKEKLSQLFKEHIDPNAVVSFKIVHEIEREASGKLRVVKSEVRDG